VWVRKGAEGGQALGEGRGCTTQSRALGNCVKRAGEGGRGVQAGGKAYRSKAQSEDRGSSLGDTAHAQTAGAVSQ